MSSRASVKKKHKKGKSTRAVPVLRSKVSSNSSTGSGSAKKAKAAKSKSSKTKRKSVSDTHKKSTVSKKSESLKKKKSAVAVAKGKKKKGSSQPSATGLLDGVSVSVGVSGLDDVISSAQRKKIYSQRIRDLATKYGKRARYNDDAIDVHMANHKGSEHKLYLRLFAKIVPAEVRGTSEKALPSFGQDNDGTTDSALKHLKAVRARMDKRKSFSRATAGLPAQLAQRTKKAKSKKTADLDTAQSAPSKAKKKAKGKKKKAGDKKKASDKKKAATEAVASSEESQLKSAAVNSVDDTTTTSDSPTPSSTSSTTTSAGKKRPKSARKQSSVEEVSADVLAKLKDLMADDSEKPASGRKKKAKGFRGRRGSKAEDMLETAIKSAAMSLAGPSGFVDESSKRSLATRSSIGSQKSEDTEDEEGTSVNVCCRFRPTNIMEKKEEVKLFFVREFDFDDTDFRAFIAARHKLLEKDKRMHAEGRAKAAKRKKKRRRKGDDSESESSSSEDSDLSDMEQSDIKQTWTPLCDWTVPECCKWLQDNDLEDYKKRFRRRKVNGAWLIDIPEWNEKKPLEIEEKEQRVIAFKRADQSHCFGLDTVLGPRVTQEECFARLGVPIVDDIIDGYNCTLFAYGQTGTGKTHTMFGPDAKDLSTCEFTAEQVFADLAKDPTLQTVVEEGSDDGSEDEDMSYHIKLREPEPDVSSYHLREVVVEDGDEKVPGRRHKRAAASDDDSDDESDDDSDDDVIDHSFAGALRLKSVAQSIDRETDVLSKTDRATERKRMSGLIPKSSLSAASSRKASRSRSVFVLSANAGLIPRILLLMFQRLKNESTVCYYNVQMAFIEIYNEGLRDLIKPKLKLTLRYIGRGSAIDNMSWWDVNSTAEALQMIAKSKKNRQTASTKQNLTSSRSHCIIQCKVEMTLKNGKQQMVQLNLCDLAGSEKVTKTGATSVRLAEAKKIVQSLFALKKVIRALSEKKAFVPYQDSVLTKLLRDSLGGNSKTTMLVCASGHAYNREETLSTLRFAEVAKKIMNEAVVNRLLSREEMEAQLKQFQTQLQYLRKQKASKSRFTSTDFRVLHSQLSETAKKAEEFQTLYLQSEIQLLVKSQYVHELEQILSQKNKELVKAMDEINARRKQVKRLKAKVKKQKQTIDEAQS